MSNNSPTSSTSSDLNVSSYSKSGRAGFISKILKRKNGTQSSSSSSNLAADSFRNCELISSSWKLVLLPMPNEMTPKANFATYFYERVFEIQPDTRELFGDIRKQGKALIGMLEMMIKKLESGNLSELRRSHEVLGRRHVNYNVHAGLFKPIGIALFVTLEHRLGEAWTPEVQEAWEMIYAAISNIMIKGLNKERRKLGLPIDVDCPDDKECVIL